MELILKNSTKVVVFKKDEQPLVLRPQSLGNRIDDEIKNAISQNAEIRRYYKPNVNLEIIKTSVPPHYQQPWHTHKVVHEAMLVIKGCIEILTEEKGETRRTVLCEGDLSVLDRGLDVFHTVQNPTDEYSTTLTFKFLGPDEKKNHFFKGDWYRKPKGK